MRAKIYMKSKLTSADNHHYEKNLESVQNQLSRIQQAYFVHGERAVIVLEGLDASGKGGLIRRLAWAMDPRGCHVWPISAPDEAEKREHYMQRFWRRLPAQGSLAVFDRSWYGRVLVERVEGLCKPNEWKRAYREINEFERDLVDNGFKVIKIFLQISSKEQLKRFRERLSAPEKRWKLTFEDFRNRKRTKQYSVAFRDMFHKTSTPRAQWNIISSDHKKWSRLQALKIIAKELSEGMDLRPPKLDPKLIRAARESH